MSDNLLESIEYKNYSINIYYDVYALNPFEEWDCMPDLIVCVPDYSHGHFISYGNYDISDLPELTKNEIKKNIKNILIETGYTTLLSFLTDNDRYQYNNAVDAINNALVTYYEDQYDNDKLEFYSFILDCKNIINLCQSVHGYSQGDYAEVLAIAGSDFINSSGANYTESIQLKDTIDLYGSWAFGDVYFFTIEDNEGNTIESMAGFYGDHEKSGLIDEAKSIINYTIQHNKTVKFNKIKSLIKSHTPLIYRSDILSDLQTYHS